VDTNAKPTYELSIKSLSAPASKYALKKQVPPLRANLAGKLAALSMKWQTSN
jgi:hypothetical protein